jgi:hypothetical protein
LFLKGRFKKVPRDAGRLLSEIRDETTLQKLGATAGRAESLAVFEGHLRTKARAEDSARKEELVAGVWREAVLTMLGARFGPVPIDVGWLIEEVKNKKTLQQLNALAFRCLGWEEFRFWMRELGTPNPNARNERR